jgi:hypothetical protein
MDLATFKMNCVAQSFLFSTKVSRVFCARDKGEKGDDKEEKGEKGDEKDERGNDMEEKGEKGSESKMKIQDCRNTKAMEKMIGDYIAKQHRAHYQSRLAKKEQEEREILALELVDKMMASSDIDEFCTLFKEGLKRNDVSVVIYDTYQLGYQILKEKLFDPHTTVPVRKEKLWIFVMGCRMDKSKKKENYEGEHIWNKGNVLRIPPLEMNEGFEAIGLSAFWETIYPTYKARNMYMYRDSNVPNRHSHCNSKASYWARGYSTVGKYFADITEDERKEYLSIHTHCCGIWNGKLVKLA